VAAEKSDRLLAGVWPGAGIRQCGSRAVGHEVKQVFPSVEGEILDEGTQVLEEGAPRGLATARTPVAAIHEVEDGVHQTGEQNQGRLNGKDVLFTVLVIMLEVVPLAGIKGIALLSFSVFQRLRPAAASPRTFSAVTVV
jgi:hypothetical protein